MYTLIEASNAPSMYVFLGSGTYLVRRELRGPVHSTSNDWKGARA